MFRLGHCKAANTGKIQPWLWLHADRSPINYKDLAFSMALSLPEPTFHTVQVQDATLAYFEWQTALRGIQPTVLLVHATGFHARVWDQVVAHLPGRHVIAVEQRGHGRSAPVPFDSWEDFGRDLAGFAQVLTLRGTTGVGHSMGAHALVQAAALQAPGFNHLVLVDPVIREPAAYQVPPATDPRRSEGDQLHPAAGRKNHFESAQAMQQRFESRPPYAIFDPQALRDYCIHGLRPADDGKGFVLCCAPQFEGKIYSTARQNPNTYSFVRALQIPVTVVRARAMDPSIQPFDPLGSPTWPGLAREFKQGIDVPLADKTHLLPMEDPALMARLILEYERA